MSRLKKNKVKVESDESAEEDSSDNGDESENTVGDEMIKDMMKKYMNK